MDALLLAAAVERHAAALTLYARQWVAAPEDVIQESFIKLAQQTKMPEPLAPWLFAVVRNAALSAARSSRRRLWHEQRAGERKPAWFVADEDAALDGPTAVQWLQSLPDDQREAITLHLWGDLSFAETAVVMGCSASSAHRAYRAGLATLQGRIVPCPKK